MNRRGIELAMLMLATSLPLGEGLRAQDDKDMVRLRATMKELVQAYGNREIDKVVGMFTEDAMCLVPDREILKGRPAIREYLASATATRFDFDQELVALKIEGNLAYEVVNQMVTIHMKDQPDRSLPNKFLHIWRRQKDGSWQLLIDMVSTRPTKK